MKSYGSLLALLSFILGGCSLGGTGNLAEGTQSSGTDPTEARIPLADAEVQEDLIAEWRPSLEKATVLMETCFMMSDTSWEFHEGEIGLERAIAEQEEEARFIRYAEQVGSSSAVTNASVVSYLERMEVETSVLTDALEAGHDGLLDDELWYSVSITCTSLNDILKGISAEAQAAGLTDENLGQMEIDIYAIVEEVYGVRDGRTAAGAPTPTMAAVSSSADQEQLKAEWGPAYNQVTVLFETCVMAYQTHWDFGQGVIDLERAKVELEAEADFVEYVLRGIVSFVPQSEAVAAHVLEIEAQASALTEWLDPDDDDDIGTPEALDAIDVACGSLQGRMNTILADAKSAGMGTAAFLELGAEIDPMIEDLYNWTTWGR